MTDSSGTIPQPEDIYERTKVEGQRRLGRPTLEMISTALAAGFDIVAGVLALALVESQLQHLLGRQAAHVAGSAAFGIGFAFLVVGKAELFTENFLVPIAGLEHRNRVSWAQLAKLWLTSPFFNIVGGLLVIVILSAHSVLPFGTGAILQSVAERVHANGTTALFFSAVFAGALVTAMTWFVEGQTSMLVRVVVAWSAAFLLALGSFDHVIVVTLELIFGYRFGADLPWLFILGNFGLAAAGNVVGGVGLVTLNRLTQGSQGARRRRSA
jgi:formate/nitrite transporter FocA (FNT family)